MRTQPDDKAKTAVLLLAIVLVFTIFGVKMFTTMRERQVKPDAAQPARADVSVPITGAERSATAGTSDPFWRPFSTEFLAKSKERPATSPAAVPSKVSVATISPVGKDSAVETLDLELQGIVTDEASIAIIRVGDQVRYLREGAEIDPSTHIKAILPGSVVLRESHGERTLVLGAILARGGSKSAARIGAEPYDSGDTLPTFAPIPY